MILTVLVIAISIFFVVSLNSRRKWQRLMPPGPKGLPFLGNIFQIPAFQFLRFAEWKTQYGPIISVNLAGQPVIVINSLKIAVDLLQNRSAIYSDRPRFIVASEIMSDQLVLPLVRYGDSWRKFRRATHDGLKLDAMHIYQPSQELEAISLVENLFKHPELWAEEIKKSTASTIKTVVYGTPPITSASDPVVDLVNEFGHRVTLAMQPGNHLVEFFPKMLYIPAWLAPWKREAIKFHNRASQELQNFMQPIKEQVNNGTHRQSFAANLHLARDRHQVTHKEEAWIAGTVFTAGYDTSSASFRFFILAMTTHPKTMKKAQAELDRVIGRDRVPSISDTANLPYIRAMVKEVLRWGAVAPLGVPRQAQQDDYYDGYLIPKGALVLVNSWGINNDPEIYPNPHEFRPERFLDPTETIEVGVPGTRNQGHVAFGFGRRICVGMNLATQFLFINIATILWAANIEPGCDEHGRIIKSSNTPENWVDEGAVIRPKAFPCRIVPRFSGVEQILRSSREERSS